MKKRILQKNVSALLWTNLLLLTMCATAQAQQPDTSATPAALKADVNTYKLLVVDENDAPIVMVGVLVKNTGGEPSKTDESGLVTLLAQEGATVQVSLDGTVISEMVLTRNFSPVLVLSSKNPAVQRYRGVRLLNNTRMPAHLTAASTQAVYTSDLTKMPVTSIKNTLAGRLAGFYTNQTSGLPGNDEASVSLRGQNPLVLIDGIPRNLTLIDPEEIESVTVLKDALATAMLGVRGSNGALLITTRQGVKSRQRISFTAQTAFQQPLDMPKALNAFQYASLRNEAVANEAKVGNNYSGLLYTDASLQGYKAGTDPYNFPDVDWRKQVLRSSSRLDRYSLNVSGGSNTARYFLAMEHVNQTGLLNTSGINKYETNNGLKNYLIRSNVDVNITPRLTGGIHLLGRILTGNEPGATVASIFNSFLTTPNNAYPVYNPNGSYGGVQAYPNNIWAQAVGTGYRQSYARDILADFYLKRTLDDLLPGLWIRAIGSYSSNLTQVIVRDKPIVVYQMLTSGGSTTYKQFGTAGVQQNTPTVSLQGQQNYQELALGYDRVFNKQGITALLLANRDNSVTGAELPYTITGTSGRVSYNYQEKYVAEASFGYNGSNRYAPDGHTKRGFFPAVGAAWNINKEDFLKKYNWLNTLRVFASYGKTGWDNPGYFSYIQRYFGGASTYFGTAAGTNSSLVEQTLANPAITWEKANKLNAGVSGSFFHERLGFTIEYYNMKFYDLLMQRGKNTALLGNNYPNENIGRNRYTGWDMQLNWQEQRSQHFSYYVSLMGGIQQSKVLYMDEVNQPYAYMNRTGQRVGQAFGYIADGLFQSQAEINGKATLTGYTPQPGDVRYKDLNGDGIINELDQAPIGVQKPLISYGLNLGFTFHSFDFTALLQGAANRNIYLSGNSYWEFQNNGFGQAYGQHLNRWTPATAATATYPRLSIGFNPNNQAFSSYWMRSGNYLRLKNIELGYTLPARWAGVVKLSSARLFVSATNLLTFTQLTDIDPEVNGGAYPMLRAVNVGVNIKF